jgi:carboxypeptidase C (cathepsin A)
MFEATGRFPGAACCWLIELDTGKAAPLHCKGSGVVRGPAAAGWVDDVCRFTAFSPVPVIACRKVSAKCKGIVMCQSFFRGFASLLAVLMSTVVMVCGQNPQPTSQPSPKPSPSPKEEKSGEFEPPPPVVTEHTLSLPEGKILKYKAITGYLLLTDTAAEQNRAQDFRGDDESPQSSSDGGKKKPIDPTKGTPKAQIFFVAYLAEDAGDAVSRPVTFAFNGGPGAASVWLHMGGIGPRRAKLSDAGEALPLPAKLVDNESTWLPKTDLVFVDPVGTGYSRAAPGQDPKQFWGFQEDIQSVGDFIRLWITRYGRWGSPKFIAGESYGTTRAAGLSNYLGSRYGLYLNGIVLIGSALNFQAIEFSPGNDQPYPLFLPSYAVAAWYHKKLAPDLQQLSLTELLPKVEQFAATDYQLALFKGDQLPADEKTRIASQLAQFTGLSEQRFLQLNLRETADLFFVDLLREQSRTVGRYDSRFTGLRAYPGTDREESDPSDEAVDGSITSAFYQYVREDLKFQSDLPYERLAELQPWLFAKNKFLEVAESLKKAMNQNPYLRVMVCCGYYDLATPYFAAESVVHKMHVDPSIRNNLQLQFYDSGHMVYIELSSRKKLRTDFEQFVDSALSIPPVPTATRGGR